MTKGLERSKLEFFSKQSTIIINLVAIFLNFKDQWCFNEIQINNRQKLIDVSNLSLGFQYHYKFLHFVHKIWRFRNINLINVYWFKHFGDTSIEQFGEYID